MKRNFITALVAILAVFGGVAPLSAQVVQSSSGGTRLPTTCTNGQIVTYNTTTNAWDTCAATATGTVTSVSVTTANGVSGSVATATTTPAITLTLSPALSTLAPLISPSFTTPSLGAATATTINGNTISTGTGTLTLGTGSTLATSATNSITLTSTGATNVTLPTTGTLVATTVATLSSLTSVGTIGTGVWQGTAVAFGYGGTGLTSAVDDTVMVSSGTAWVAQAVANCVDTGGNHLNYTASTNAFSCGTSGGASGANTALSNLASVAINLDLIGAVAGGMGVRGGSAANDDLTLEGTTSATRTTSYVFLQPTAGKVAIGSLASADKMLSIKDATSSSTTIGNSEVVRILGGTAAVNTLAEIGFTYGTGIGETYPPVVIGYQVITGTGSTSGDFYVATRNSTSAAVAPTDRFRVTAAGDIKIGAGVTWSSTAPTISSGFGTTPTIAANNGTAAFTVNVGTGGTASSGVIGMPTATTGWNCSVQNRTGVAANRADQRTIQTATATTTVTVQNQTISTGAALAWTASDVLALVCVGY